ncbi:hypothetical protein [Poriferisphaera corsica]|nr:hypothetical protein [Poriferisphaera corsica]
MSDMGANGMEIGQWGRVSDVRVSVWGERGREIELKVMVSHVAGRG